MGFGDTIRLSDRSRVFLDNVESQGRNQCVILHLVAGTQWDREGKKNGVPTLTNVLAEAEEWRREEFSQASAASSSLANRMGPFATEIKSVSRDAANGGRDRDYR